MLLFWAMPERKHAFYNNVFPKKIIIHNFLVNFIFAALFLHLGHFVVGIFNDMFVVWDDTFFRSVCIAVVAQSLHWLRPIALWADWVVRNAFERSP